MTPADDPPELPKLPPVRESAEHVLPPPPGDGHERGWEEAGEAAGEEGVSGAPPPPRPIVEKERRERSERRVASKQRPAEVETPAGREGRRRNRTEDGRRFSTAGNGLVVAVLALCFGALLNAPDMHKSSFNKQPGTERDVALALTGGLAGISGILQLDQPRRLVQSIAGRENADTIDVAIVIPPPQESPVEQPSANPAGAKPPGKPKFTPQRKLRLWVAGDSLVITPGYSIARAASASPVIDAVGGVDGRVATGLTRPDVFNWFEEIRAQVKELRPNVVVLDFGGNDDKGYMTGVPEGTTIGDFGGPSWRNEYRRRVAGVMNIINRAGATVVWIGLPITRSEAQTQRFDVVNAVVQKEAKARGSKAIFIDTYTMFAGNNGGFTEYLENAKGDTIKVRAGDGVHFDTKGGDMIAREVLKQLNATFDLTSWRRSTSDP